jgi:uncharacterized protein (TIGR03435 family)
MALLARFLSNRLQGPLQDLTGLTGTYDIDLTWESDAGIFTALRESLGLKQEASKASVDTLVIDHIERVPTEN